MDNALLTLSDAATTLSLGKTTLRKLIDRGEIRVVRIGGLVRVPRSELQRWIESQLQATGSRPSACHPLPARPQSGDHPE